MTVACSTPNTLGIRRIIRRQKWWKVPAIIPRASAPDWWSRWVISRAARRVKVSSRIRSAGAPVRSK